MADQGETGNYSDPLYEAVSSTVYQQIGLLRQNIGVMAQTTGPQALADITPKSNRPEEFPGIRSYYAKAKELNGLQVRTNWQILATRFDPADKSTAFVVATVVNPHPGAHVLMFGATGGYIQYAHIDGGPQKQWPRKTARRLKVSGRPAMMTNWQTLSGNGHWFHAGPYTHGGLAPHAGFAEAVATVMQKFVSDGADEAFNKGAGLTKNAAHNQWIPGIGYTIR